MPLDELRPSDDRFYPDEVPSRRSGGSLFRTCFILFLVGFVLCVVLVGGITYIAYQFTKENVSTDPVVLEQWLRETVPCSIPDGYEAKNGFHFGPWRAITILPKDVAMADSNATTSFFICSLPGVDFEALRDQFDKQIEVRGEVPRDFEETRIELKVGPDTVQGTKREWTDGNTPHVEYDVLLRRGVLFVATGPTETFDHAALEAFLASVQPIVEEKGDATGAKGEAIEGSEVPKPISEKEPR